MSNCNKISELLSAYIDGEISAKEKELVENHLLSCTSCKQKLEIMQKTSDILKATPQIPVPETLLKDFGEYRKKAQQTEKKVVPLYKNYRVFASVAAIFIFAFVLKSGLLQEDKFMPDTLTQSKTAEQSIDAPVNISNDVSDLKDSAITKNETETQSKKQPEKQLKTVEKAKEQPIAPVTQDDAQQPKTEAQTPALVEAAADQENSAGSGGGSAAYNEPQSGFSLARTADAPAEVNNVEVPVQAIVYVAEEDLEKATKLLDGEFFFAQIEQKLNDNFIPFESNFLSLDEGVPHKVVVMVKEQ